MPITKLTAKDIVAMFDCGERLPSLPEIEKDFVVNDELMSLIIEYWTASNALHEAKKQIRRMAKENRQ